MNRRTVFKAALATIGGWIFRHQVPVTWEYTVTLPAESLCSHRLNGFYIGYNCLCTLTEVPKAASISVPNSPSDSVRGPIVV